MFHTPECFIQELPCSDPIGRPNDMVGRSSLGRHDVTRLSGLHVGVVEVGVNVSKWDIVRPRPLHTCNIHKVSGIIGVIICASVFWSIKLSAAATHSATRRLFPAGLARRFHARPFERWRQDLRPAQESRTANGSNHTVRYCKGQTP